MTGRLFPGSLVIVRHRTLSATSSSSIKGNSNYYGYDIELYGRDTAPAQPEYNLGNLCANFTHSIGGVIVRYLLLISLLCLVIANIEGMGFNMEEAIQLVRNKNFHSLNRTLNDETAFAAALRMRHLLRALVDGNDLVNVSGNGYNNCVRLLIKLGININHINYDSFSALMLASRNGHSGTAELLIQSGADVNQRDEDGLTALRYAALFNRIEAANILLKNGADVNRRDRYRWTPLLSAVENDNPGMARLLLNYNADPNLKTARGEYPLITAIINNNTEMVNLLAENGANLDVADVRYNYPAVFWAVESNDPAIVQLFIDHKANLDIIGNRFQETPLIRAVTLGNIRIIEMLLDAGADITVRDNNGWNAEHYADTIGDKAVIRLLSSKN